MRRLLLVAAALFAQQPVARFPSLKADNVQGKSFNLPAGFPGTRTVVFVAFGKEQQTEIDTWTHFLTSLVASHAGTAFVEFPTLKRLAAPLRWTIRRGMKSGIKDAALRERTIPLFIDKDPFRAALGIPDERDIYLFLVDREGKVYWRETGAFTEAKGTSLKAAVTTATAAP